MLFPGDLCATRSGVYSVGLVDRTFHDLDSQTTFPDEAYPDGVDIDPRISPQDRTAFLGQGVPPRDWVVMTWQVTTVALKPKPALLPESELFVLDRELLVGDVVKRNPGDAMSGVVTHCAVYVDIIPPAALPWSYSAPDSSNPRCILRGVPTKELVPPVEYSVNRFVLYKDWVGRIRDVWADTTVQLSNRSVVTLEDGEDIYTESQSSAATGTYTHVGDFIKTKKGSLRRGKWVFGAFDPNIEPSGYVVDLKPNGIEVEWLSKRFDNGNQTSTREPPFELEREQMESGELHVYDTMSVDGGDFDRTSTGSFQFAVSDKVRFKDVPSARIKYKDYPNLYPEGDENQELRFISRQEALGYDLNVFRVVKTHTKVKVLWQDLTESHGESTQFVPSLDLEDDDDLLPGELVASKASIEDNDYTYAPSRIGIIQSVDSRDRIAQVRWFSGLVSFAGDDHAILLPDSNTGELQTGTESVSLYEIRIAAISRRIGDLITFVPPPHTSASLATDPKYGVVQELLDSPCSLRNWVGEVVELGLDGLLTVRLGGSSDGRDVRVPWDCTYVAHSADDHAGDEDEVDGYDDSYGTPTDETSDDDGAWVDEDGNDITENGKETGWVTDDEDDPKEDGDGDVVMEDPPLPETVSEETSSSQFSYANMFPKASAAGSAIPKPDQFDIIEGSVPDDHHFRDRVNSSLDGQRMRRIQREHRILSASLPEGAWVRTWESALNLMRILILGPLETPYEYTPFVIDLHLDSSFPTQPPKAFFHSWTRGDGPINPNLYEDGTICLSLLGTWPGDAKHDNWNAKSTILQIVVSILGLVLVKEPYYNEAGYESRVGSSETRIPSALYSERTYLSCHDFILHALRHPIRGFEDVIDALYKVNHRAGPMLLVRAIWNALQCIQRNQSGQPSGAPPVPPGADTQQGRALSRGALVPLRRYVEGMIAVLDTNSNDHAKTAQSLRTTLDEPGSVLLNGGPFSIFDKLQGTRK